MIPAIEICHNLPHHVRTIQILIPLPRTVNLFLHSNYVTIHKQSGMCFHGMNCVGISLTSTVCLCKQSIVHYSVSMHAPLEIL